MWTKRGVGVVLLMAACGCGSAPNMAGALDTPEHAGGGDATPEEPNRPPGATSGIGTTKEAPKPEPQGGKSVRLDLELSPTVDRILELKNPESSTTGDGVAQDHKPDDDRVPPAQNTTPTPAAATGERLGGNVDATSVRTTLTDARELLRRCSDTDIKLELELTITPSGDVVEASASSSAPDDIRTRDCVVSTLRKLRFQPFAGSEAAHISLGLALRR